MQTLSYEIQTHLTVLNDGNKRVSIRAPKLEQWKRKMRVPKKSFLAIFTN